MKKYRVVLKEVKTYIIEVEGENEKQVAEKTYHHQQYTHDIADEIYTEIVELDEIE